MSTISDILTAHTPTICIHPTENGAAEVTIQFADRDGAQAFFEALEIAADPMPATSIDIVDLIGADRQGPASGCTCAACWPRYPWFRVCAICGNKRCPHAEDHRFRCHNSNDPGQIAELIPTAPPAT